MGAKMTRERAEEFGAAWNSGDADLAPVAAGLLGDASALVRGMAVWALNRLDPALLAARRSAVEADPDVLAEWAAVDAAPAGRA